MNTDRIVVTVVGKDKVGIIANVTSTLAQYNANIIDISQTIMKEFLTMIMLVDIGNCSISFNTLKEKLEECAEEIEVKITVQHEDVFHFMHRI